jgi:hypothetical protein
MDALWRKAAGESKGENALVENRRMEKGYRGEGGS